MKKDTIRGFPVKLQLWDTGGQERFRTITKSYYERAMGVILVYDCSDERSFIEIRNWIKQIEAHAHSNIVKILVAAKCDIADKKVESAEGEALAKEFGIEFFETSAKLDANVTDTFQYIAGEICKKNMEFVELRKSFTMKGGYDRDAGKKGKKCC